jgi:hypothetical protein
MSRIEVSMEPGSIAYLGRNGSTTYWPSNDALRAEDMGTRELASLWVELQAALVKIEPELIRRGFPITPSPRQPST